MCGIAGQLGGGFEGLHANTQLMVATLLHRGPDDAGIWVDNICPVALGHRRLSIVDLSAAGHQPMSSPSGRYTIVLNGEIYNHQELRRVLEQAYSAPAWRGNSDTETFLAAVEMWGIDEALKAAVGMFAFAIWDRQNQELIIARDRFGEKPLYYGWQRGVFLFGSELKAICAHPSFQREINKSVLADFCRYGYIAAPHSIWKGISKLIPGTYAIVRLDEQETRSVIYWSLDQVIKNGAQSSFKGSEDEATEELERLLSAAVKGQMLADVPLGALLSGGVDSSLVTALMKAQAGTGDVRTYSIGFADKRYDESGYAAAVARHLGTNHTSFSMEPADVLAMVPKMAHIYDEPFGDSSQLPTALVMSLARRHATVVLTGDAGDETFGGYSRYSMVSKLWKHLRFVPMPLQSSISKLIRILPVSAWNSILYPILRNFRDVNIGDKLHKLADRIEAARTIEELYLLLPSGWGDADRLVLGASKSETRLTRVAEWPAVPQPVSRFMAVDTLTYMPDDILVKVDRAAMAVSLETRAPFLDHRLVEFAWSLPESYKYSAGSGKQILKRILYRHVPKELIERPKKGFAVPMDSWLRCELRDWAEAMISSENLSKYGLLDVGMVREKWDQHISGNRNFGFSLWPILMLQAWLEQWNIR